LLTPSLNLQILPKANPQILQKSPLKSIKSSKKYEINKEARNNFMNKTLKTLEEEIKEIRKKRGISPEDFEMITGVSLETIKKMKNGDKTIEGVALRYNPYNLEMLASLTSGIITAMVDSFLDLLNKKEHEFGKIANNAKLRTQFELSAYILFILDVFAFEHQTSEARKEIFYVASNEILKSLQKISSDYQKSEFNIELCKKIDQYSSLVREPDGIFKVPSDTSVWNLLQENLTNAVAEGGFTRKELDSKGIMDLFLGYFNNRSIQNNNKSLDIVSLVYGMTCQQIDKNFRLMINELFSASEDIRDFSSEEFGEIQETVDKKIRDLDKQESSE